MGVIGGVSSGDQLSPRERLQVNGKIDSFRGRAEIEKVEANALRENLVGLHSNNLYM